jgi:predicted ATP-grasp superfamily ATP-dependent carboligase
LLEQYEKMEDPAHPNLMFQEYIPGGGESVWMFNACFNVQSDCLVSFTGQELGQFPAYGGMASLGVCVKNETVDQTDREFLKKFGYRGIVDLATGATRATGSTRCWTGILGSALERFRRGPAHRG